MNEGDELKFPEWLTDKWLEELEQIGFDWDIDWDFRGRITLSIWKMTDKVKKELEEADKRLKASKEVIKRL